ncbi:MAG: Sll0314/Alr1548 family TPR repeat-containing protein [Cyanobacteria bacterium J06597_1]
MFGQVSRGANVSTVRNIVQTLRWPLTLTASVGVAIALQSTGLANPGSLANPESLANLESTRADIDPFRTGADARDMAPEIARAMNTFFCRGDYVALEQQLEAARSVAPEEPMVYVAYSALAYMNEDYDTIREMTGLTLDAAAGIKDEDPLRSHLYTGVGNGMRAATIVVNEGIAVGLPQALPSINTMFSEFRTAQNMAPDDSEVNFFVGFIDLMMTRHDRALTQFQTASSPQHMADWGQALTYRDMGQYEEGLAAIERALSSSCEHPEHYYLQAQLLRKLNRYEDSVAAFDRSLASADMMPEGLVSQISRERERTYNRLQAARRETASAQQ